LIAGKGGCALIRIVSSAGLRPVGSVAAARTPPARTSASRGTETPSHLATTHPLLVFTVPPFYWYILPVKTSYSTTYLLPTFYLSDDYRYLLNLPATSGPDPKLIIADLYP